MLSIVGGVFVVLEALVNIAAIYDFVDQNDCNTLQIVALGFLAVVLLGGLIWIVWKLIDRDKY